MLEKPREDIDMNSKEPVSAEGLMPHERPMRLVDTVLCSGDDGSGEAAARIHDGNIFVDQNGLLAREALAELMAQAFAAINGKTAVQSGGRGVKGYLVGIKQMHFWGEARAGDYLTISIRPAGDFAGFVLLTGEVRCQNKLLASGELKIWLASQESGQD